MVLSSTAVADAAFPPKVIFQKLLTDPRFISIRKRFRGRTLKAKYAVQKELLISALFTGCGQVSMVTK